MTFEPISMTMPSLECQSYISSNQRMAVLDRLKQRISSYDGHARRCAERYKSAQVTVRANEKRDTMMLWQRMQEMKNKKGAKCKIDSSRQKVPAIDQGEGDSAFQGLGMPRMGLSLKRKMGSDATDGYADPRTSQQKQDSKRLKDDLQQNRNQRQQGHLSPSVSVTIVPNFGAEVSSNQFEATVDASSNKSMQDSESVSVGPKTVKQEVNDRYCGQKQQQTNNQTNMNQCPSSVGNLDSNDFDGILGEDFMNANDDIDISILHDFIEQMPDMIDELNRELMAPERQSQQMTTQAQQIMPQFQRMTSQSQDMSQSQPQQMALPSHITSQSQQILTSQPQKHQRMSQSQPQYQVSSSYSQSLQQVTSPLHHHHMSSPAGQHMTTSLMQQQQQLPQNSRMLCKSEKADGFRGNTNFRVNSHQNNLVNITTQKSVQVRGGNFSTNISSQQNLPLNMMQLNNLPTARSQQMLIGDGNTSQHIFRPNQDPQFTPHDHLPPEMRQGMFHPQANSFTPSVYHSQHLKQLAEDTRNAVSGAVSMSMDSDARLPQRFSSQLNNRSSMTRFQMNMSSHHVLMNNGSVPHRDADMCSQFVQPQRPGINNTMPQSIQEEAIIMKQYQVPPLEQCRYYNRIPESHATQRMMPINSSSLPMNRPSHVSWNTHETWPSSTLHKPMHHCRPQLNSMQPPHMNTSAGSPGYFRELDQEFKILDEILSKSNA